jgi:outer membrane protein assembly factor BamB
VTYFACAMPFLRARDRQGRGKEPVRSSRRLPGIGVGVAADWGGIIRPHTVLFLLFTFEQRGKLEGVLMNAPTPVAAEVTRRIQECRTHKSASLRRRLGFCPLALIAAAALLWIAALPTFAAANGGGDWPQLLGPRANGISAEIGLLDHWPAGGPPLVWEKQIGTGYGAPSVLGDRLVFHHRIGEEEVAECLEAATGKPLWHGSYPSHYSDPYGYNNGPRSTPLLTSNLCYTFGAEGRLQCRDLQNGKLVWERDTAADFTVPEAFFGVGSTPILEGGLLLVMVGGQPEAGMVAFDAKTGKTVWQSVGQRNWEGLPKTGWPGEPFVKWQTSEKQASYSTPVAVTINGRRQVLCLMRQGLVSLDPKTGAVNFSFWFRSPANDSVNAMCPVVVDDMIFISGAYYKIGSVLLKVNAEGKGVQEIWRSTALEQHWSTPIYLDGCLYAFSGRNEPDARMRCIEFQTGKVLWDVDESWPPHSTDTPSVYGRGSFILADGKLIALGEGGILGLLKPDPRQPTEICRAQIPQLHHPCWAAPVLSRKLLYLRSEDHLICLNLAGVPQK